ncbi:Satratoxin biosynthesis SC1 cluster protein 4 [Apiospora kogelbergensis]|uniref:Satratoxin biosynthesis SC1 cluster protein 4 n=1 Tax=Apiospora kogelbergensis TaxID=1337665 RepID=UPI00312E7C7B
MAGRYASEPPAGQQRTVDHPPNRRQEIIVVGTIALAIGITALSLRLFTRVHILRKRIKLDDYFVVLAMICAIVAFGLTLQQVNHGLTYHKWDIPWDKWAIGYPLYAVIETCFYTLSVGFAKLSILCWYLQLSPEEWFRWSTMALIGAVAVFSVTYACVNLFPCQPVAASWNYNIENSTCLDTWGGYLALSILNIVIDVATLSIPIPILLPLQITVRQKISLIALFGAGAIVCAITIARASIIPSLKASEDRPWDVTIDYLLAFLEMNMGVVCASVPALKPFFIRYLPSLVSSHLSRAVSRNTPGGGGGGRQDGGPSTTNNKGTPHMYHLNTVVETNRQRRRMQSRSYALGSRDDNHHKSHGGGTVVTTKTTVTSGSSGGSSNKKGGNFLSSIGRSWAGVDDNDDDDDELRLWPSSSPHYYYSQHQHSKSDEMTVSANTIEALHGGGAVHTASVSVDGSSRGQQGAGISVLKETSVSYEQ